ncbi:hypothetical protein ACFL0K_03280, partial [Patescibacteria group bacterium]
MEKSNQRKTSSSRRTTTRRAPFKRTASTHKTSSAQKRPATGGRTQSPKSTARTTTHTTRKYAGKKPTTAHKGAKRPSTATRGTASRGKKRGGPSRLRKPTTQSAPRKMQRAKRPVIPLPVAGENVRIIPLGGVEEVGRNMTVVEYKDDIIIFDVGFQFEEES